MTPRASGVLLHVTSLPGEGVIGDLGQHAHRFVDWLASAGQRYWQVLPLGPTGYGHSPYQTLSAYAGSPLLISLQSLAEQGWLDPRQLQPCAGVDSGVVDFELAAKKLTCLEAAAKTWLKDARHRKRLAQFEAANGWLTDYARYCVLKQRFDDAPWYDWPQPYVRRDSEVIAELDLEAAETIAVRKVEQLFFAEQWSTLKTAANRRDISIIGDCPIYVAHDSAEVWSEPDLFDLDTEGQLITVAGVPPDYFSETGQRWGNPIYDWDAMSQDGFAWWRRRLAHQCELFDLTRIDHFRGFDAYWRIPAAEPTAINGEWCKAPGHAFFEAVQTAFPGLPFIAEDLGLLDDGVHELRDRFELPGMRVLQFGFDGQADNPHHPSNIPERAVCYTGTHDNDTSFSWYHSADADTQRRVLEMDLSSTATPVATLVRAAFASAAGTAIVPMQDLLELDGEARFNTPSTTTGNWRWRLSSHQIDTKTAENLRQLTADTGRLA